MRTVFLAAALAAAVPLTACSSPQAPPVQSAPVACKDFTTWYLDQGGNVLAGKHSSLLSTAVKRAPSGQLYQDLSTLRSDVTTATVSQSGSMGTGTKLMTVEAAYTVEQDCQAVNPSS
jgi:hypothetical protein